MNLQEMTEEQLKALAYDQMVLRDQATANLQAVHGEIQKRQATQKPKSTKE